MRAVLSPLAFSTARSAPASRLLETRTHTLQPAVQEWLRQQRSGGTEGEGEVYSLIKDFTWRGGDTPASPWARVLLTVLKPPPLSQPGYPELSRASWGTGRQGPRGQGLRAGQAEAPGRHVAPTLSQVRWFTGLTPQSCLNEKPRGPSAWEP